jgi:hypothetical protein
MSEFEEIFSGVVRQSNSIVLNIAAGITIPLSSVLQKRGSPANTIERVGHANQHGRPELQ